MNSNTEKFQPEVRVVDENHVSIVIASEGPAGSTPLRADCGVVAKVDNWDPARLVELVTEHDGGSWSDECRKFVGFLTGIDAGGPFDFMMDAGDGVGDLPATVSSLAVTRNQYLHLSPIYGLNALQIRSGHEDLFDIENQMVEQGVRAIEKLARSTGFDYLIEFATKVRNFHRGEDGVTKATFLESIATRTPPDVSENDLVPPYPVPRTGPLPIHDAAIEILPFDIDHDFVDRACWTFSVEDDRATVYATSRVPNTDVFAEIVEKGPSTRRVERIRLVPTGESSDGSSLYTGNFKWNENTESRFTIHESDVGESSTRSTRVRDMSRRVMASVAARLHAVGSSMTLETLRAADPVIRTDVEKMVSLLAWTAGDTAMAKTCSSFLEARTFEEVQGFRGVGTSPTIVDSIRARISQQSPDQQVVPTLNDLSQWRLLQKLDRVLDEVDVLEPWYASVTAYKNEASLVTRFNPFESRELSLGPSVGVGKVWETDRRKELWLRSRPAMENNNRWIRFAYKIGELGDKRASEQSGSSSTQGNETATQSLSWRLPYTTSSDEALLWRLRLGQAGL